MPRLPRFYKQHPEIEIVVDAMIHLTNRRKAEIVLFGSDIANNQPVAVKYLEQAKSRGARVIVVNPYREPGLEKYWVPSSVKSALVGTKIADAGVRLANSLTPGQAPLRAPHAPLLAFREGYL